MPPQKQLGGAGGSWDDPNSPALPIPIGLTPGHEPTETAIPRAIDAVKERVPTSVSQIPQVIKNALVPSLGEGGQADVNPEDVNAPQNLSTMFQAAKNAAGLAKKTYTTKSGLKNVGSELGSDVISSVSSLQPKKYAADIKAGNYAGAGTGAAIDAAQTALALAAHEPGARLPGENPAIGEQAVAEHLTNGGSTYDPRTGRSLTGTNNWSVGVAPERTSVSPNAPTPESYSNFVSANADLLKRNPNLHVGTWHDAATGLHHMDLVATTPNKSAAVQMAKNLGETSVYHLGRGELVQTSEGRELAPGLAVESYPWMGHTEYLVHDAKGNVLSEGHRSEGEAMQAGNEAVGYRQRPPLTGDVESRAQELQQATPAKQQFYGYHLSNDKLDYLDGNRRGLVQKTGRPVGQEAARLNLKSDTGVGENAPAGFYAYSAGTRPEPAIAGRKFSHEVRGNFAMADVTDPKWNDVAQNAYNDALQKTGNATLAQYAATNAKELAIRDAGYDGYTAPGTGINFFFDGMPTKLVGAPAKPAELPGKALAAEAGLTRTGTARKGLGSAPTEGTSEATDVANPWANLPYDHQAIAQAQSEAAAGKLPQGVSLVQRAQQLKEELMGKTADQQQGGHAGNGVASVEELNRAGNNFLIDRNGKLTYHGKSFAPEETPTGGAHVTVMKDGSYRLNEGTELNPAQKASLQRAAKELGVQNLRPQGESSSVQTLHDAANDFNKQRGRPDLDTSTVGKDSRAAQIADAFDQMKHSPNDPTTKASYAALIQDIKDQWNYATKKLGIKIEPTDGDPYKFTGDKPAAQTMFDDVTKNKHLGVYRGGNELQPGHPLAKIDPQTGESYNTMLRAVHDIFGHAAEGHDFGEKGEENAWNLHRQMFSPQAVPALTTETKGQTSWFFNNKKVRNGAEPGEFAEQKAGLLPEWAYKKTNGASFPGENPASVQNGDPLSLLTDNERNQAMTKRLGNQFTNILRKLPAVSDFEAAARKGASGRTWYQRSVDAFDAMRKLAPDYFKPEDADKFANVVAATSPQQGVPLNLRDALTFWKEWNDAGRPTNVTDIQKAMRNGDIRPLTNQPSKLPNVVRALNDEDMLPSDKKKYYKVGNFGKNLTKAFGNVTLDSWMGNFANVSEQNVSKPQFYHALALRTRQAAQKLGWHPAEAQAAIWTFTKTLAEMSGWKAAGGKYYRPTDMLDRLTPDKMKAYSNDFADIMKTDPEVRAKLSELGVDLNELDKRLENVTPKPTGEALEGADQEALARGLRRNAARIGKSQRNLEGFTEYSRPPAQGDLEFGSDEGDSSFPFGGPLAKAIRAGGR